MGIARGGSLSVLAFRYFGGYREFNPMVVVFRPFRRTSTFRFWQAFRDNKHGKTKTLDETIRGLFEYLTASGYAPSINSLEDGSSRS